MKRTIPVWIAAITGFVLIAAHFVPPVEGWGSTTMDWFNILAAVAFLLGGADLLRRNLEKVSYQRPGWGYAAVTVIAFSITLWVGLFKVGVPPNAEHPDYAYGGQYDAPGSGISWVYDYMYYPLSATMFALLAFFVASAAFRAFRAKNTEATVLLSVAFVVLLGRTFIGVKATGFVDDIAASIDGPPALTSFIRGLRLDRLTDMIMNVFNLAGIRAITIGIALGVVSTSLKVLLGVDRSYLGSDRD